MSVHAKLMKARLMLQNTPLKKSGHNKFAGYYYFELGDFLPTVQEIFSELNLCGIVSYTADMATLTIIDTTAAPEIEAKEIIITSPMGSAALKGCHEVQNIGAVETYQRRYLWVTAMEIVEHDALDSAPPVDDKPKAAKPVLPKAGPESHSPAKLAFEMLTPESQDYLRSVGVDVISLLNKSKDKEAYERIQDEGFDADHKAAFNFLLDSKQRSALKAIHAAAMQKEPA